MRYLTTVTSIASLVVVLTCSGSAIAQQEQAESTKTFEPKRAMDFFAGSWRGKGIQGSYRYTGRESAEWDLHHNIMSHRTEFFGRDFANTLLVIRRWDPVEKKIAEHQFASWNVYRRADYEILPHGEWFQLVGSCTQTGENGERSTINILTVHDENHYTWTIVPKLDSPGAPFFENYSREGVEAREDETDRTGEYLAQAIQVLEDKSNADPEEVSELRWALAQYLMRSRKHIKAVKVLEKTIELQAKQPSPDEDAIETSRDAILRVCRNFAFTTCLDGESSEEDLRLALKMANRAKDLAPDDPNFLLHALVLYRLAETKDAQEAIRKSLSQEGTGIAGFLLLAMIEHQAGNVDLAQASYTLGAELASKFPPGNAAAWKQMARDALGDPAPISRLDKETRLALYQSVLDAYPKFSNAYQLRGRYFGSLGQWDQALADYHQAAELLPTFFRAREAEAAITIRHGTAEQKNDICRKLIDEWQDAANENPRMDVVLMCSLCPEADIDRQNLLQIADEVLASIPTRMFLQLAKGMALYRLGRYNEAATTISIEGSDDPKNLITAQAFLAMTHEQLGHHGKAKQLLNQAKATAKAQLDKPDGPPLPYQDRPVAWCMVHTALDEATQLIDGSAEEGESE